LQTFKRLAGLQVTIDAYRLKGLLRESSFFDRHTTVVQLEGRGRTGVGEDVVWDAGNQRALQQFGDGFPLEGTWTLASFSERLAELDLFPRGAASEDYRHYRRWAFESAALDLALRQAGRSLADVLGLAPRPFRFVCSMGLGKPPDLAPLERWLELYPDLQFKLDVSAAWDDAVVERLAATGAVATLDLKGAYKGTPVDLDPDPVLYDRVVRAFAEAWIEDPAWTAETAPVLEPHLDRITWDAPIHSVEDIRALAHQPRVLNFKPSRFGSLEALLDAYDHCAEQGIGVYGGGQWELGPGRGQIQALATLFHPDAPNDVAPHAYNEAPEPGLPGSPLDPALEPVGFGRRNP
jgi:L-alanine-DL-glutamate epimerase-like enolase superfamily enzyme